MAIVLVSDPGPKKIGVIKEVRAITGLGLRDAKNIVDSAPVRIECGSMEEAEDLASYVVETGGKAEILGVLPRDEILSLIKAVFEARKDLSFSDLLQKIKADKSDDAAIIVRLKRLLEG